MFVRSMVLIFLLVVPGVALAQFEEMSVGEVYGVGVAAYEEGDAAGFVEAMAELNHRRPFNYSVQYNYTIALAMTGEIESAISQLEYMADLGFSVDIAGDEDFAPLRTHPRHAFLSARLLLNNESSGTSDVVHEFDITDVLPEGFAYREKTGEAFLSTVRSGQIFRINPEGEASEFANGSAHSAMASILGMAVDELRGLLWVASATPELYRGSNSSVDTGSALLAFDLTTGAVVHAFELEGDNHFLGEVVIAPDGDLWASDSGTPMLYRVNADLDGLVEIDLSEHLLNVQGFAFFGDNRIIVADYIQGLFDLDLLTGRVVPLEIADGVNPIGVDGLFFYDGNLIAIQNATHPKRIIRFNLFFDGYGVTSLDVLVNNHPLWDEPTLGQIVDGQLLYMATSEWSDYGADGTRREGAEMHPIRIMSVDLD